MTRPGLAPVLAVLWLVGCLEAPVERTNLLDIGAALDAEIVGVPDTLNSNGESHTLTLVTTPELPPGTPITWRSTRFDIEGNRLTVSNAQASPLSGFVEALIGNVAEPRVVRKSIVDRQRPFRLELSCANCEMPEFGIPLEVSQVMYDSLGNLIRDPFFSLGWDWTARDGSLLQSTSFGWKGVKNGQSWIVASVRDRPSVVDSVLLTIWQVHRAVVPICPDLRVPGDTGSIVIDHFWDRAAFRVEHDGVPPQVVWSSSDQYGTAANIAVTTEGFVTAVSAGIAVAHARFVPDSVDRGVPDQVRGECVFNIAVPPG